MSRLPRIAEPSRKSYPSDLSDSEWEILRPLLPKAKGFGHPRTVDLREILNGIFYVQRTGCQWEMLPHDFPPYTTVYGYFHKWQRSQLWQNIHDKLRTAKRISSRSQLRHQMGRDEHSIVAIADSQSVKTTEKRDLSTVLTVAKKLKAVNAILWSILKASLLEC